MPLTDACLYQLIWFLFKGIPFPLKPLVRREIWTHSPMWRPACSSSEKTESSQVSPSDSKNAFTVLFRFQYIIQYVHLGNISRTALKDIFENKRWCCLMWLFDDDNTPSPSSSLHDTRALSNLLTYGIASSVDHYVGLLLLTAQLIKLLKIADQSCGRKRTFTEISGLFLSEQAQRTGTVEKHLSCRSNGPEQ